MITAGKPTVDGIDPNFDGLLVVRIPLNPRPDDEWTQLFLRPPGVGIPMSMHPPKLYSGVVQITPPDSELDKYVSHINDRIDAANAEYERSVRPRLEAEQAARVKEKQDREGRLEAARQKLAETG